MLQGKGASDAQGEGAGAAHSARDSLQDAASDAPGFIHENIYFFKSKGFDAAYGLICE